MDGDKFFVVSWGSTESRYNPNYHRGLGYSLTGWGKLGRVAAVKGGKRIPLGDSYANEDTGFHYLRVDNLGANGAIAGDMKWLTENTYETLERYRIFSGDVLISIAGTIGRIAVFDETNVRAPTILTENCAKLHIGEEVLPKYLMLLLLSSPLQKQMARDYIQTTIPKLGLDRIRQLRLPPIPEIAKQEQVVAAWHMEWNRFKDTNLKAAYLLDSIDDYLLAELGITLPPEPENTLASRIFTSQRRELAGWRFDPLFHSFKLWHAIETAQIPHKKLGLCCHYLKSGFAAGGDMQLFDDGGVIQLRPTNIDANREWTFEKNIYLSEDTLIDRPGDIVQPGEVLFNNTNSQELVGKTVHMSMTEQPFFCSNHMTRIQTIHTELNPEYLAALLNAYQRLKVFFSLCTNWNNQSDNQSGVNVDLLRQLPIPVPPLTRQAAITEQIGAMRKEAKCLHAEAQTELEAAKRRIEAMLLGGAA